MSLLLCHDCYMWVDPRGGRCPECLNLVDTSVPDPPLATLQARMGDVLMRIGKVQVKRKMLPDRGMLYATSNGLYFLPHRLEHIPRMVKPAFSTTSVALSIAGMAFAPIALLLPFVRTGNQQVTQVPVLRPQYVKRDESHLLPVLLMENPGVFFLPRTAVREVVRRRNTWRLERWQGAAIRIKPDGNRLRFHARMDEVFSRSEWHDVAVTA